MFVRVVRFTDVDPDRMSGLIDRIGEAEGPPPGVDSTGIQVLVDADQGTAVVVQHFASRETMEESAKVLEAMDASETPGTRASVDSCELKVEMTAP